MAPLTRRSVVKQIGLAGAGFLLAPVTIRGVAAPITVAGRPVEIAIAPISDSTVRITVQELVGGLSQSGVPNAPTVRGPIHAAGHDVA